jgi:hypothetical protein
MNFKIFVHVALTLTMILLAMSSDNHFVKDIPIISTENEQDNDSLISGEIMIEEFAYIVKKLATEKPVITDATILTVLVCYYDNAVDANDPNPKNHYNTINEQTGIELEYIKEIFDKQSDFLKTKGLVVVIHYRAVLFEHSK